MPRPPFEGYMATVKSRQDYRQRETGKVTEEGELHERPWVVLSDDDTHKRRIFAGIPQTHKGKRKIADLCVRSGSYKKRDGEVAYTFFDTQQPWTFPNEQLADTVEASPPTDGAAAVTRGRRSLANYLDYASSSKGGWLYQGRVVWVRLQPTKFDLDPSGQPKPSKYTDVVAWELIARRLHVDSKLSSDWLLPAVVVTHDDYLPRLNDGVWLPGIYPLVTVVPLVVSAALVELGKWTVAPTGMPGDWAPVTQCLLTLDYWATTEDRKPCVVVEQSGYEEWAFDEKNRRQLMSDVGWALNLQP